MLKRKVESDIEFWIEHDRDALLVTGARQVGKTFTIRTVFEKLGIDFVEFNLLDDSRVAECFAKRTSISNLLERLSYLTDKEMIAGKTFIFFDEIQVCKDIVTQIKFLVDEGSFRYVLSGSLLGVEIKHLRSAPVGYLRVINMYPLDFEEFLQVFKISSKGIPMLRNCFETRTPVDEMIHRQLIEYVHVYLNVGGMPSAVEIYAKTKDMRQVMAEHDKIKDIYEMDFTQYEEEDKKLHLHTIYELIPKEINDTNKRFKISDIKIGSSRKNEDVAARMSRVEGSFLWLTNAGVAIPVYNAEEPKLAIMLNDENTFFKLFLSDVGMLTTMAGKGTKYKIVNEDPDINKGAIYENFVAQELYAHGYAKNVFYFSTKKMGELDFIIDYKNSLLPIEVKSGKNYNRHSALNNVLNVRNYGIKEAFILTNDNISVDGNRVYYPIYMTMFIKNDAELGIVDPGPAVF
ncbi:MAG: ATP-binding protein [Clostridia bacterium]|nr:ATP-binding protein [Clostridia bacterium]